MTSLGKVASAAGVAGTVVLSAVTHDTALLLSAVGLAAAGIGWSSWILSSDRRVERLNVLLRGGPLPTTTDQPHTEPEPESALLDPQVQAYLAQLRKSGNSELAAELEQRLAQLTRTDAPEGRPV